MLTNSTQKVLITIILSKNGNFVWVVDFREFMNSTKKLKQSDCQQNNIQETLTHGFQVAKYL